MTATVIHIISDATIKSGPAGEIRYTWSPESTWRQSLGANSVLTYIDVVTISSDAELKVQGQWSLDGRNWTDFGDDLESSVTAVGAQQPYYAGGVNAFEFGPYVRYGVSIADRTSGTEESARCTVSVVVRS